MQYRGFGSLHSRILLAQQYDIERLEDELDEIDRWDQVRERDGGAAKLGCKRRDDLECQMEEKPADYPSDRTRPELLAKLKQELMCYGEHRVM